MNLKVESGKLKVARIGHLENQIMIGGDLAVKEPARMLISILNKIKRDKNFIYEFVKNFYTKNEFEVLYNQLQSGFNCVETSSTGRVLDAAAVLLGFAGNERKSKHEAAGLLEKAAEGADPHGDIEPTITKTNNLISNNQLPISNEFSINQFNNFQQSGIVYELKTTPLFEYLIKNLHKDKARLAATAQLYIARGLWEIVKSLQTTNYKLPTTFFSGGLANNKIMAYYLASKGVYVSKNIPRGDAGISIGQVLFGLYNL